MRGRRVIATGIVAWLACGPGSVGPLAAQPVSDSLLRVGARVRVTDVATRVTWLTGTLVRWQSDTIVVVRRAGDTATFRLIQSHRVDVGVAGPQHILRNGFIGAATGAVVLGTIGALMVDPEPHQSDTCVPLGPNGSCWTLTVGGTPRYMGAAFGAAYGAAIGGLVGLISGTIRHEQWKPVAHDLRVAFVRVPMGTAVTVSIPIGRASR